MIITTILYIRISDIENLKRLFLFHWLLFYLLEKKEKKSEVTILFIFQGGQI